MEKIKSYAGQDQASNVRMAALDFLRNKLGVTEQEIKQDNIVKTSLPEDSNIPRIYVEFSSHDQADFCLDLVRTLKNPDIRVVKNVPKKFRARNAALEHESYILRRHTYPLF